MLDTETKIVISAAFIIGVCAGALMTRLHLSFLRRVNARRKPVAIHIRKA